MAKKEKALDPFDIINSELNAMTQPAPSTPPTDIFPDITPHTVPAATPSPAPAVPPAAAPPTAPSTANAPTDFPLLTPPSANYSYNTAAPFPSVPVGTAAQKTEEEDDEEEEEEGSGCLGYIAKGALILFLAGVLAWIIFMPSGSMEELKDYVLGNLFGTASADSGHDFVVNYPTTLPASSTDSTTAPQTTASTVDETAATTDAAAAGALTTTVAAVTTATTAQKVNTTTSPKPVTTTTAMTEAITLNHSTADTAATYANEGYIYVYLKSQIVVVYDNEDDVRIAFTCSSGKASTPTKTGDYKILSKYRWRLMIGNCYTQYASSFSSGYLFHSIPYNRKNPATMSNASYDKLGSPASAGCVRLCFRDAKWVYDNCPIGTYVRVTDDYAPAGIVTQSILPRINDTAHSGWDPTDTDPSNPYYD